MAQLNNLPPNPVPFVASATVAAEEIHSARGPKRLILAVGGVVVILIAILAFTGRTIQSQNLAAYLTQCKVGTLGATAQVAIYTMFGTLTPTPSTTPLVPAAVAQLSSPTVTPVDGVLISPVPSQTDVNYMPPNVELGKAVFASAGCSACHDVTGKHVTVGPSLMHIVTMAKALFPDAPVDAYLRQSILEPDRYTSPGYPAGIMPKNYMTLLSNAQLNNVIAYLMTLN